MLGSFDQHTRLESSRGRGGGGGAPHKTNGCPSGSTNTTSDIDPYSGHLKAVYRKARKLLLDLSTAQVFNTVLTKSIQPSYLLCIKYFGLPVSVSRVTFYVSRRQVLWSASFC